MAAGGVPLRDKRILSIVFAALEIQQFMKKMKEESIAKGEGYWELDGILGRCYCWNVGSTMISGVIL